MNSEKIKKTEPHADPIRSEPTIKKRYRSK